MQNLIGFVSGVRSGVRLNRIAVLLFLLAAMTSAKAASTWNSPAGGNWNTAGNWTPATVPASANTTQLIFNASGTTSYTTINDIGAGAFTLNNLQVNNTGVGTVTINGAAAANTLIFAGATPTIDVSQGAVLFLGKIANGAAPNTITKIGAGAFIHDSDNAAFTGTLNVNAGLFVNRATSVTPANFNPVSIVVNNGGTYQFGDNGTGDPNLPNSTFITVNTGGTVIWQEGETFGGFHLQGGTINMQSIGGATTQGTQNWTSGTVTGAFAIGGIGAINKTTAGIVTVTGTAAAITTTGSVNIQDGVVSHVALANLGTSNVTMGAALTAGTFEYKGATGARAGTFTLVAGGGGIVSVTTAASTLSLSGSMSGSGPLAKIGAGTLNLSGTNNYTGTTDIRNGTLQLPTAIPAANTVNLGSGTTSGKLVLGGASIVTQTLAGLTNAGTGTANRVVGGNAGVSTLTLNIAGQGCGGAGDGHNSRRGFVDHCSAAPNRMAPGQRLSGTARRIRTTWKMTPSHLCTCRSTVQ
jgi:autotransporter-associated beta strand protein